MSEIKVSTVLDLIKNNNSIGFELLYKYHYKLLYSAAFSVTNNEEDCKDIIQNAMFKLSKINKNRFPDKGEVSWLYRVVSNEAIDYIRTKKTYDSLSDLKEIPIMDDNLDKLFDMKYYYSLIQSLNDQQQEIVTLKVIGGFTHKEISQILGRPIGTIQWIYNTSIKRLRMALAFMATSLVIIGCGAYHRGQLVINSLKKDGEGSFSISSAFTANNVDTPSTNDVDYISMLLKDKGFIILMVAFIIFMISLIIFYFKSDKLPTKLKKHNV